MKTRQDAPESALASPSFSTVLVDTSLLIEQQKLEKYAGPVKQALAPYGFKGISSYSKLEFKRAWLQRLGYLHTQCLKSDVKSLVDVQDKVNRLLASPHQRRRVQTCVDALLAFLRNDGRPSSISDHAQLGRLRSHCKLAVLSAAKAISEMATGEFKRTGCVRAEELPKERSDGSLDVVIRQCKPTDIKCSIHTFFDENSSLFCRIAERIEADEDSSQELQTTAKHIRLAGEKSVHLCDDKHCRKIADTIIAIDGKDMDVFAANNDKDWVTLASVLNKTLLNPVKGERIDPERTPHGE